ncbi:hypothetical protein, partial [Bacillus cereus]|uniref:hypothetical protein n=1 Tax=Bacillus cereus TaxID=1396 RepID=UPI000AB6DCE7
PMYVVCIKNKKSLKKRLLIFCMEGVLQMIDYYQMFLIAMAGIALFFIYNMLENQRKETKGSF